jgi:hypothetical protein
MEQDDGQALAPVVPVAGASSGWSVVITACSNAVAERGLANYLQPQHLARHHDGSDWWTSSDP